jgi:ATP-binding cassette subfamily F protein uup
VAQDPSIPGEQSVRSVLIAAALSIHGDEQKADLDATRWLTKLQFDGDKMVRELSGGWVKRLAIAEAFVKEPDVVLFDEPTNHLDLEGIRWLEASLRDASFAWVMVSHDRHILDTLAKRMLEVSSIYPEGTFISDGGYTQFLDKRVIYLDEQRKNAATLANKVRRETEWLARGPQARTTKAKYRVNEALNLIQELSTQKSRLTQGESKIDFASTGRQTKRLVVLEAVGKSLGGRPILSNFSMVLTPGMSVGILGENGAGKSTLLKLMTKDIEPDSGIVTHAEGLKITYFDQLRRQIDPGITLKTFLADGNDSVVWQNRSVHVATWAQRFQFRHEQLSLLLGDLSGGEKARALIAKLMLSDADVLLLDEPTNDLDIPTLEALEDSLAAFPGAIVVVTHDQYFLKETTDLVVGLDGRGGAGLFADSEQWQASIKPAKEIPRDVPKPVERVKVNTTKRLSYLEQREYDGMEAAIAAAETQLAERQSEAHAPEIVTNAERAKAAYELLSFAEEAVEKLYERWAELEAKVKP